MMSGAVGSRQAVRSRRPARGFARLLAGALILALAGPAAPGGRAEERRAVAVWPIESLFEAHAPAPAIENLAGGRVIEAMRAAGWVVVERERLDLALAELQLGSLPLADERTRLRIGRMAGATHMVFGSCVQAGGQVRLDLRLVEVERGHVAAAAARTADGTEPWSCIGLAQAAAEALR